MFLPVLGLHRNGKISSMHSFVTDFFSFNKFIYLFIYLWLCWVFVSVRGLSLAVASGATLHRGARASHYRGLSCCGAQAPDAQAQQLWLTGQVAPRHVGSSQTRARTRVPCTGRQTLNHCTTREAPIKGFIILQNALLSSTAISSPHYNN